MGDGINNCPTCVCCAQELKPPYKLIFDKAGLELKLPTLLFELFNLKLTETDSAVQGICDNCLSDIIQAFDFTKHVGNPEDTKKDLLRASQPNHFCEIPGINTHIKHEFLEDQISFVEEDYLDEPTVEDILVSEAFLYAGERMQNENNAPEATIKKELPFNNGIETGNENFDFRAYKASVLQSTFQDICFPAAIKCRICSKSLGKHAEILTHTEGNHCVQNFVYPCIVDGNCSPLSSYQELSFHLVFKHYDLHSLIIYVQCKTCKKRFNNFLLFNKHSCFSEKFSSRNTTHCYDCGKEFRSTKRYRFHLQFHMDNHRPMGCFICDIMIPDEDNFFNHIHYGHEKIKSYPCLQCDRYYNSEKNLLAHEKTHNSEKLYQCKDCSNSYSQEHMLKHHMTTQHIKPIAPCPICGKRFTKQLAMDKHIESHAKPVLKDVPCCSICGLVPENEANAEEHKSSHENEVANMTTVNIDKAFVCEYCEKAFKCHTTLIEHRKTHTDRRYTCRVCLRSYKNFKSLNAHCLTHPGYVEKRASYPVHRHYLCDDVDCSKSFLHWTSLTGHKVTLHDRSKVVTCKECPEISKNVNEYNLHQKLAHSNVLFICQFCSKQHQTRLSLGVHIARMHYSGRIKCDDCDKEFANSYDIRRHKQAYHQPHKCEECGRVLKNKRRFKEHQEKVHKKSVLIKTDLIKTELVETDLIKTELVETDSVETDLVKTDLVKTELVETELVKTELIKTELVDDIKQIHCDSSFPCRFCDHKSTSEQDLITHMKEHTNKKKRKGKTNWDCKICGDIFKTKPDLDDHMKTNHKIIYKCPYAGCTNSYPIRGSLNAHIRRKHVEQKDTKIKSEKAETIETKQIKKEVKTKKTKRKKRPVIVNDDDGPENFAKEQPSKKKTKSSNRDNKTDIAPITTDPEITASDSIIINNEIVPNSIVIKNEIEPEPIVITNETESNYIDFYQMYGGSIDENGIIETEVVFSKM